MDQDEFPTEVRPPMPPSTFIPESVVESDPADDQVDEPEHVGRSSYKDDTSRTATDLPGVAMEVVEGKWGTGQERRQALADAGFDPNEVQKEVVRIMNDTP